MMRADRNPPSSVLPYLTGFQTHKHIRMIVYTYIYIYLCSLYSLSLGVCEMWWHLRYVALVLAASKRKHCKTMLKCCKILEPELSKNFVFYERKITTVLYMRLVAEFRNCYVCASLYVNRIFKQYC